MAASLPVPDDCRCRCATTATQTVSGASPQQVYSGVGPPNGLQVGVGGVVQNPAYDAIYTDKVTGVIYPWNTATLAWGF